jgi:septal ring factor EnvC (AmiA/AmiB activator)
MSEASTQRIKQLERGYDELRKVCNRQQSRIAALEAEVARLRNLQEAIPKLEEEPYSE